MVEPIAGLLQVALDSPRNLLAFTLSLFSENLPSVPSADSQAAILTTVARQGSRNTERPR